MVTIIKKVGRAPEPVWTLWKRKNIFPLPGIEPIFLGSPARHLDTVPTDLITIQP
jgi:hypothetical protein